MLEPYQIQTRTIKNHNAGIITLEDPNQNHKRTHRSTKMLKSYQIQKHKHKDLTLKSYQIQTRTIKNHNAGIITLEDPNQNH